MALKTWISPLVAVLALGACGGKTITTPPDESAAQEEPAPTSDTIPMGTPRPAGAVGSKRCSPLDQPPNDHPTTPTKPFTLVGQAWNRIVYVVDADPNRSGRHRAFIQRGFLLERHALSEDEAKPDTFIIDRGLPNQIVLTKTSLQGAGTDGPLMPVEPEQMAIFKGFANDSPESLAYAPHDNRDPGAKYFFVLGPVAHGVLGVPRVFYGPRDAIQERAFLGFSPADSSTVATAATSVTFDLDGTPTTLPTIVTRETQGLINGFGTGALTFLCF